jgi:magnesium transporter
MPSHRKKNRRQFGFHRRTAPGAAPGTIAVDPAAACSEIQVIAYGPDNFVEERFSGADRLDELRKFLARWPVTWVNIDGLGDAEVIRKIGQIFGLHSLALEDVVNVHQRSKVESYADHLFIVARMVHLNDHLETEQVGLFLGKNFVVTFQESAPGDSFGPVRERLRASRSHVREAAADYLAYALLDSMIDAYFPVLEVFGERVDELEEEALSLSRGQQTVARIHDVKNDLLVLRRAIWPLREAVNALQRDPTPLIHDNTRLYLRDCYDHTVQLIDLLETYRELGSDLRDLYLAAMSNRMNEIMKVLTVISTIFMPLTFIAGVYGMNFDPGSSPWNMPELRWYYGYPLCLLLMAIVTAIMFMFFRRRGWIGKPKPIETPQLRH